MKRILLIRHAESTANAGAETSMPQDIQLTDVGHSQAVALADSMHQKPGLIVTSAFTRTVQTARPLMARFPDVPHEQWPIHEFTYLSPNRCLSTTTEQRIPLAVEYWNRCDPDYSDGDGAESFSDFLNRVRSARQTLRQRAEQGVLLFSHYQFINGLRWVEKQPPTYPITPEDMENFRQFLFTNAISNGQMIEYDISD